MTRVILKKLPPHWSYIPSKRQVRALLDRLEADVRVVEYHGTAYRPRGKWVCLGFLEARVVERAWCFYFRFWGLPDALAGPVRECLSDSALGEAQCFIGACLARRPRETIKPRQLHLSFAVEDGLIRSACRAKVVDRYSYPTGDWWMDSSAV
jgi:hypothetical protein